MPTPGGPMKRRIGPFLSVRSWWIALYSTTRFFTFTRPRWSSSRAAPDVLARWRELVDGRLRPRQRSAIHSKVGLGDVELRRSAAAIERRRPSCFLTTLSTSAGTFARRDPLAELLDLVVVAATRPSFLFDRLRICWRRMYSRCDLPISSWTIEEISFLTRRTSSWRPTIARTRRTARLDVEGFLEGISSLSATDAFALAGSSRR